MPTATRNWKSQERIPPRKLQREQGPAGSRFQTSGFKHGERRNFRILSYPMCDHLLQLPQDTDISTNSHPFLVKCYSWGQHPSISSLHHQELSPSCSQRKPSSRETPVPTVGGHRACRNCPLKWQVTSWVERSWGWGKEVGQ